MSDERLAEIRAHLSYPSHLGSWDIWYEEDVPWLIEQAASLSAARERIAELESMIHMDAGERIGYLNNIRELQRRIEALRESNNKTWLELQDSYDVRESLQKRIEALEALLRKLQSYTGRDSATYKQIGAALGETA